MINKIQLPQPVEEHFHATNTDDPRPSFRSLPRMPLFLTPAKNITGKPLSKSGATTTISE